MELKITDGGRKDAGFKGEARDCFCRAVAIATGIEYRIIYEDIGNFLKAKKKSASFVRKGMPTGLMRKYMEEMRFEWTPTMKVGDGCRTHFRADELPGGTIIVRLSGHIVAVIDGVAQDNHDPRRGGSRCVYGYWKEIK